MSTLNDTSVPPLPVSEMLPGLLVWIGVGVGTLALAALPWLPPARRAPVAEIDLDNCNGCGRCHDDCPFGAITMAARTRRPLSR